MDTSTLNTNDFYASFAGQKLPATIVPANEEITRLANFKGLSEFDFIQQFTRLSADRIGSALEEEPDGGCIFLEGQDCAVQTAKPQTCKDFPNLWNFPGFEKTYQAIPWRVRAKAQ